MVNLFTKMAIFILLFFSNMAYSQRFLLKDYSISYRVFEMNAVGNNPTTITPFLKSPVTYQNFLHQTSYTAIQGNPGVQQVNTFYVSAGWKVNTPDSKFWERYTLNTGLLLTSNLKQNAGSLLNQRFQFSPDTMIIVNSYVLSKNQKFLGGTLALSRHLTISKKLQALTAIQVQGSIAIVHYYKQQFDSSVYSTTMGWKTFTTPLNDLKGKNFIQWQVMLPIGLEYPIYKNDCFLRFEIDLGIVGSRYRPKRFAAMEAHGIGLSLLYQPKKGKYN